MTFGKAMTALVLAMAAGYALKLAFDLLKWLGSRSRWRRK